MKILIPNATSPRNIGDQAMLEVLLELLKNKYKNARIVIQSTDPYLHKKQANFKIQPTLYSWSVFATTSAIIRVIRLMQLVVLYIEKKYKTPRISLFINDGQLRNLVHAYEEADIIVFAPGGYLRSQREFSQTLNLMMQLVPFAFAKLFHAKKIVAPISFGPFAYTWQERLAAYAFDKLDLVAAREKYSLDRMKLYRVKNLILSTDYALLVKNKILKTTKRKIPILGFTVRKWFSKKKQVEFENNFADVVNKFAAGTNATLQPIVQVNAPKYGEDDEGVTRRIISKIEHNVFVRKIIKIDTVKEAQETYAAIDLLLGMRMHSNILAATQGVPFVAVSYEYKTEGIAKQIGMEKFCISCEKIDKDNLNKLLMDAYKNRRHINRELMSKMESIRSKGMTQWQSILTKVN